MKIKRSTDCISELIKLGDWHIGKVCSNKNYFEVFMGTNNEKMICRIISPTCRYYPLWYLYIANSDEFDGQWHKSSVILTFKKFNKLKDFINWIDTSQNIDEGKDSMAHISFK